MRNGALLKCPCTTGIIKPPARNGLDNTSKILLVAFSTQGVVSILFISGVNDWIAWNKASGDPAFVLVYYGRLMWTDQMSYSLISERVYLLMKRGVTVFWAQLKYSIFKGETQFRRCVFIYQSAEKGTFLPISVSLIPSEWYFHDRKI